MLPPTSVSRTKPGFPGEESLFMFCVSCLSWTSHTLSFAQASVTGPHLLSMQDYQKEGNYVPQVNRPICTNDRQMSGSLRMEEVSPQLQAAGALALAWE